MKRISALLARNVLLVGALGALTTAALASQPNPDVIYVSSASLKVNTTALASPSGYTLSTRQAAHNDLQIVTPLVGGDTVELTVNWTKQNNGGTVYPKTLQVGSMPGSDVPVSSTECYLANSSSTCSQTFSFTAPVPAGASESFLIKYGVQSGAGNSQTRLITTDLFVNFTVEQQTAPEIVHVPTSIIVDPKCVILRSGVVELTATLTAVPDGQSPYGLPGAALVFSVEGAPDSNASEWPDGNTAYTNDSGVAAIRFNVNDLDVGDHTITVTFAGMQVENTVFDGQQNTSKLGIDYLVQGFLPPVNADGTSSFANGKVIPLKIRLLDANRVGGISNAQPQVFYKVRLADSGLGTEQEAASVATSNVGNIMRYSPADDQYIFNMNLGNLANGVYYVYVKLYVSDCALSDLGTNITIQKKGK